MNLIFFLWFCEGFQLARAIYTLQVSLITLVSVVAAGVLLAFHLLGEKNEPTRV